MCSYFQDLGLKNVVLIEREYVITWFIFVQDLKYVFVLSRFSCDLALWNLIIDMEIDKLYVKIIL